MKIDVKNELMTFEDLQIGDVFWYTYEERNYEHHIHYAMKISPHEDEDGEIYNAIDLTTSIIKNFPEMKDVYYLKNAKLVID